MRGPIVSGEGSAVALVYHVGCPRVGAARALLRHAFDELGLATEWEEWRQDDPSCPEAFRSLPSPTIWIPGSDVSHNLGDPAASCRLGPLPTLAELTGAIQAACGLPDEST
jgi:hypothetical protein